MSHRIQNDYFLASTLCFALLFLSGCDSKKTPYNTSSAKPPAALTQTITLRPHGTVMFPDGETTQEKPWAATAYVNTFGDGFNITKNGYKYSATSVWALDNQAKYTIDAGHYKRYVPEFAALVNGVEVQASLAETRPDKTRVMEYVDLAGGVTPISVRVVITPDFHTYVTSFEYEPTAVPTEEQIQHEIEFHHSLKIDGNTIEDSLGEEVGKRYAERTKKQGEIVSQLAKTPAEAEKQIKDSFAAYKAALLSGNGEEAAEYVNKKTIMHYSWMATAVMKDDRPTLEKRSLLDKIFVLTMRHQVPYMELYELSQQNDVGRAYFTYAVDHGFIGKDSVEKLELVSVEVDPETRRKATTTISSNGRKAPFGFDFTWEDGKWKVDLTSIFFFSESALEQMQVQAGLGQSRFILAVLEKSSGKKPDDSIWDPPQPTAQEEKIIQERRQQLHEQRRQERIAQGLDPDPPSPPYTGPRPSLPGPIERRARGSRQMYDPGSKYGNEPDQQDAVVQNQTANQPTAQPDAEPPNSAPLRPAMPGPVNFQNSLGSSMVGTAFSEQTPENFVLVGFAVTLKPWANTRGKGCIESLQPLYRSRDGKERKRGTVHGNTTGESRQIAAPTGYAVGAINGRAVAVVDGFELVCMKVKPDGTLDPNDTKTSPWIGNDEPGARSTINGRGKAITEIKGYTDDHVSLLECVFSD